MGLGSARRAVSGATHKATSGGIIEIDKVDLTKLVKIGNIMGKARVVKEGFCCKVNRRLEEQKEGLIGTLLAGLVRSLLPVSLVEKTLSHAGKPIKL